MEPSRLEVGKHLGQPFERHNLDESGHERSSFDPCLEGRLLVVAFLGDSPFACLPLEVGQGKRWLVAITEHTYLNRHCKPADSSLVQ